MTAQCPSSSGGTPAWATLPEDVLRTPVGDPAVVLVRTPRGWSVLGAAQPGADAASELPGTLPLVEAMSLGDLVAEECGATPEPDRPARLAARGSVEDPAGEGGDPRDAELAALRRTVGQLEHALAARVSIERAIGVLAERHGSGPKEAFDELRQRARAQGRPAQELAREVLDALTARLSVPDQRTPGARLPEPVGTAPAEPDHGGTTRAPTARRVSRRARQAVTPGTEQEGGS
jgi:hypothetical protein